MPPPRIIHLPGGVVSITPYEGERAGFSSQTAGVLPIEWHGESIRLEVAQNRVVDVLGRGEIADDLRLCLSLDAARCNVAGLGLPSSLASRAVGAARPSPSSTQIALGRSDHMGGVVGPAAFGDPRHIWQYSQRYGPDRPLSIARITLDGRPLSEAAL
jgi:hypothetical protein